MDSAAVGGVDLLDTASSALAIEPLSSIALPLSSTSATTTAPTARPRQRNRRKQTDDDPDDSAKRRCVSTACIACRKRKSKCDGNTPKCAACSQVYGTECVYDPNSDHRRKGVYKNDVDNLKTRDSTLQTLIQAILNYSEDEVPALVREIRTCESLDAVAERIVAGNGLDSMTEDGEDDSMEHHTGHLPPEKHDSPLYGKMGNLRFNEGIVRYIGGTSNLIHLAQDGPLSDNTEEYPQHENPITSWTTVTNDPELVIHLLNMYFTWHYTFFPTLSKKLFYRDFQLGKPLTNNRRKTHYCTPILVNAILSVGCHFTSHNGAREDPNDSGTAGDHFFREAKRLLMENDEHERPALTTIQALALMSVREAGCAREAKGWVYSGMSFRMACDMGLNLDGNQLSSNKNVGGDELEQDVRRITFWGIYLFDKCWSNYLGRLPQLPTSLVNVSKYDVFPEEEADAWSPYTDSGFTQAHAQPSRTRAVGLQMAKLSEISNDLMQYFYNPTDMDKTKGRAVELRKLSDIHTRLEAWRRELPKEMEPKEGGLSCVLVMHMFFQLLFIHTFRPFLKYSPATCPLPRTVSPAKLCYHAAATVSKLMRLYKRSYGLRQIPNIAVYIAHSACTIHLISLSDENVNKNAKRDIVHGVKHLEEIAEGWPCARRSLAILSLCAEKNDIEMPEEAAVVLARTDAKFGPFQGDTATPSTMRQKSETPPVPALLQMQAQQGWQSSPVVPSVDGGFVNGQVSPSTATIAPIAPFPVRTTSGNFGPLQQHQDAQSFPAQEGNGAIPRARTWQRPGRSRRPGGSPSDMFGGVEQLIRDSNTWTYRDQAQLAMGFGNWSAVGLHPNGWVNESIPGNTNLQMPVENASIEGVMQDPGAVPQAAQANGNIQTADGQGILTWLDGMNPLNNLATTNYDENEWYQ